MEYDAAASLYTRKLTSQEDDWSPRRQRPATSKRAPRLHRAVPVPGTTDHVSISIFKDTFFADLAAPAAVRAARLEDFFHTSKPSRRSDSPSTSTGVAATSPSSPLLPPAPGALHRPLTAYEKWRSEMSSASPSPLKSSSSTSALLPPPSPSPSRSQSGSIHRHPRQGGRWVSISNRTPPPSPEFSARRSPTREQPKKQRRAWPSAKAALATAAWLKEEAAPRGEWRGGTLDSRQVSLEPEASRAAPAAASKRDGSAGRFSGVASLLDMVRSGDVLLLRARWILERAGYVEQEVAVELPPSFKGGDPQLVAVKQWVLEKEPAPLPDRQEVEEEHKQEAVFPADQLERLCAPRAQSPEPLPLVAISAAWEQQDAPDPSARSLKAVAAELAGRWDRETPTCGLPLFNAHGFDDVGCFFSYSSLYQPPRSKAKQTSFVRALRSAALWFAHERTTVYVVVGQDAHLQAPRQSRGWMDFEEAMACALKPSAPPSERPRTDAGSGKLASMARERAVVVAMGGRDGDERSRDLLAPWSRVVTCGNKGEEERGMGMQAASKARGWLSRAKLTMGGGRGSPPLPGEDSLMGGRAGGSRALRWWQRPPLAPSLYAERLNSLSFTEESDRATVRELYRRALLERFGTSACLRYAMLGWGDAEVGLLTQTLAELGGCPGATSLDLSDNYSLGLDLAPVDPTTASPEAIAAVPALSSLIHQLPNLAVLDLSFCLSLAALPEAATRLVALRTLRLDGCINLRKLPETTGRLRLQRLYLSGCKKIERLPESMRQMGESLEKLDLSGCKSLSRLPSAVSALAALRSVDFYGCDALHSLPDMSKLVRLLSVHLPQELAEQPRYVGLPCYKPPRAHRYYNSLIAPKGCG